MSPSFFRSLFRHSIRPKGIVIFNFLCRNACKTLSVVSLVSPRLLSYTNIMVILPKSPPPPPPQLPLLKELEKWKVKWKKRKECHVSRISIRILRYQIWASSPFHHGIIFPSMSQDEGSQQMTARRLILSTFFFPRQCWLADFPLPKTEQSHRSSKFLHRSRNRTTRAWSESCVTHFPPPEAKNLSIKPAEASMESLADRFFSCSACFHCDSETM